MLQMLEESLSYDPVTGVLVWCERPRHHFNSDAAHRQFNLRFAGKEAGTIEKRKNTSYRRVTISGQRFYAHVIAWALTYGVFAELVDHEDRDGLNNSIRNLRESDKIGNALNVGTSARNTSGIRGVHFDRRRSIYIASGKLNGKRIELCRGTLEECAEARTKYLKEVA